MTATSPRAGQSSSRSMLLSRARRLARIPP
jgi:hypothetical protein